MIVGNAVRALGRLRAVAGDAALLALLSDDRMRVRQELVIALGVSGERHSVKALADVLETADAGLRPLVIQALGRLGGDRARSILERVIQDDAATDTNRVFAREALRTPRLPIAEPRRR